MDLKIKLMTDDDIFQGGDMETLMAACLEEVGPLPHPYRPEWFCGYVKNIINNGLLEVYVGYDEKTSEPVALLGLQFSPNMFSGLLTAHEMYWYVVPGDRKRGVGQALLDFAIRASERRGAVSLHMGVQENAAPEMTARIFRKNGFTEMEHIWFKRLDEPKSLD